MSKRVTLDNIEIEVIIRLLREDKDKGSNIYVNAWLGKQYIEDLISKLQVEPTKEKD